VTWRYIGKTAAIVHVGSKYMSLISIYITGYVVNTMLIKKYTYAGAEMGQI